MKITFLLPHAGLAGGVRVVAIYAEQLLKRGHEVFIVSQPLAKPSLRQRLRSLLKGQPLPDGDRKSHFDGIDVPHKILERERPVTDADLPDADVVVATWWKTAEWVAALSPSKGAKAYFIQHHEIHPYHPVEQVAATYRLPLTKIVIAQWLKDIMADCYGDERAFLVPNSVDCQLFQARARYKQTLPTVGMMYSGTTWKGNDIAIEAINLALKKIPNLQTIAFGAEPIRETLPLPPNATYHYKPPQSSLKLLYAQCDAWLFSSRLEGFGLPILEAMACRTPVIATPAGAAPELLAQGGGILVEAENSTAMAEAILQIVQSSNDEWQKLSDRAYQTATSYSWEEATRLFESALETAIAART